MSRYYLAFDLGAGSGRAFLGKLEDGRLEAKEIHRFPNEMINMQGFLRWDVYKLYEEMLRAMRICARKCAGSSVSIGVDTWGVDFALLDVKGKLVEMPFAYRNWDSSEVMEEFLFKIPKEKLYQITGIQFLPFNTVFQLYWMIQNRNRSLERTSDLLLMADLFNYLLTNVKKSEFTLATTTQLYNPKTGDWDDEIFRNLGISKNIMQEIVQPGTIIGELREDLATKTGLRNSTIIAVATHDTGSAVAAAPLPKGRNAVYISSGTWSLVGIESPEPIINEKTLEYQFTNEGGVCKTFRILRNVTGLWILRRCKEEWTRIREYSYDELTRIAEKAAPLKSIIDPNWQGFLNPPSMVSAISDFCKMTGQPIPKSIEQFCRTIIESLALAHRYVIEQIKEVSNKNIEEIHIIGGGSLNHLLCQFTADATGLPVHAGPVEATAIGNILVQAMAFGEISSLEELREVVKRSFSLKIYKPRYTEDWNEAYERFIRIKQQTSLLSHSK